MSLRIPFEPDLHIARMTYYLEQGFQRAFYCMTYPYELGSMVWCFDLCSKHSVSLLPPGHPNLPLFLLTHLGWAISCQNAVRFSKDPRTVFSHVNPFMFFPTCSSMVILPPRMHVLLYSGPWEVLNGVGIFKYAFPCLGDTPSAPDHL